MGSTAVLSPRLILPTHHMYNFARRWVCWAVGRRCLSLPSAYRIRLSQTLYVPQPAPSQEKSACIISHWEGYICSWLYLCTVGPLYGPPSIPLPNVNTHTHAAPLTPLLAPRSLSSLLSGWIRSSSACHPALFSERAIHCCRQRDLGSPPNHRGIQLHYLLPAGNMPSMQTFSR